MKKILLLLLISIIICQKTTSTTILPSFFNSIQCLLKSNIIFNSFPKIIESFKTKDFIKICNTFYSIFNDLKNEFIKCKENSTQINNVNKKDDDDDMDIKLGYPRVVLILYTLIGEEAFDWYDEGDLKLLKTNCFKYYGQRTWYCNFIKIDE